MASSSEHRCVFVGNTPYDASEEQLIDICSEVGPVVSFRLVTDKETGKPKGYGFCEYKDEETALSARHNLQGYEINGQQLWVDFAENDKNADGNREQGRAGPGRAANVELQKHLGGPGVLGESVQQQPIGLHKAITAATVMVAALGGPQTAMQSNQNNLQSQYALASDLLTLHLAKMSRSQYHEIMSELKVMTTQNREVAHQLLLARHHLTKALFQSQIMLGMVTPQVLQMPNLWQPSGQAALPSLQDAQQDQQPAVQALPGLPHLVQRTQTGLVPRVQEGPLSVVPQKPLVHNQFPVNPYPPVQPQTQIPHANNNVSEHATLPGKPEVPQVPPVNSAARPQIQMMSSSSLNQQMQPPLIQHPGQLSLKSSDFVQSPQLVLPNTSIQPSFLPDTPMSDAAFQAGPSISSGILDAVNKNTNKSARYPDDVTSVRGSNAYLNMQTSTVRDCKEPINHPSKLLNLDDGRSMSYSTGGLNVSNSTGAAPSQATVPVPSNRLLKPEELQHSGKQVSQAQLPPDVESALLQQVLNLTPEHLSSLPPEQQQEVTQLQPALRKDQTQLLHQCS